MGEPASRLRFPAKLYALLEQASPEVVCWTPDGLAFSVQDEEVFCSRELPRFFAHTKMASFQRQLNIFGFQKLARVDASGCSYHHLFFVRGRPDLLVSINQVDVAPHSSSSSGGGDLALDEFTVLQHWCAGGDGDGGGGDGSGGGDSALEEFTVLQQWCGGGDGGDGGGDGGGGGDDLAVGDGAGGAKKQERIPRLFGRSSRVGVGGTEDEAAT